MKKKLVIILMILLVICGLTTYFGEKNTDWSDFRNDGSHEESAKDESRLSLGKLEDMPEISVEGNRVTVVLLQDIPLPYRWEVTGQSACATLVEEYEEEDPYNGLLFSSGSAPEYHVFVFELAEATVAELGFHNLYVTDSENLSEVNGSRKFILEYVDSSWSCVKNVME